MHAGVNGFGGEFHGKGRNGGWVFSPKGTTTARGTGAGRASRPWHYVACVTSFPELGSSSSAKYIFLEIKEIEQ